MRDLRVENLKPQNQDSKSVVLQLLDFAIKTCKEAKKKTNITGAEIVPAIKGLKKASPQSLGSIQPSLRSKKRKKIRIEIVQI